MYFNVLIWTTKIIFAIICLLEDEHELSLGIVIRPKFIYNFCLLHDYLGDIAMCFATLSYLFQHIWTNLLTQCTQCQFLSANVRALQVYTHIYSAQKIPRKLYKKSAFQKTPDARRGPHPSRRP